MSKITRSKRNVFAADDDFEEDFGDSAMLEEDDGLADSIDDISDQVEDLQDDIDDIDEDDVDISVDNNITDHYIAECDRCHGVFISAVIVSDQEIEKVSGTCPLCGKESDQYLNWKIQSVK